MRGVQHKNEGNLHYQAERMIGYNHGINFKSIIQAPPRLLMRTRRRSSYCRLATLKLARAMRIAPHAG